MGAQVVTVLTSSPSDLVTQSSASQTLLSNPGKRRERPTIAPELLTPNATLLPPPRSPMTRISPRA